MALGWEKCKLAGLNGVVFFFERWFFLFLGYRGILHPASDDEDTERTWVEPEQRPRKRVLKRSVHGKQEALCQLVLTKIPDLRCVKHRPCQDDKAISPQEGYFRKDVS